MGNEDRAREQAILTLKGIKELLDKCNQERIMEHPIEVIKGGTDLGRAANLARNEYAILISTGGPAIRLRGVLDVTNEPYSAVIEYQDWGIPWTHLPTSGDETKTLLNYASHFFFGN